MALDERQRATIDALIREEWPKLERFFRTKVPEVHVPDLAQATFVAYVEAHAAVTSNPRAYLWGIARKQVLRHWASYRKTANQPFDSATHSVLDVAPTLSSVVDRRHRVLRALQTLPADQQMAIELVECEELTIAEAAEALTVSVPTLNRYLAAARTSLRSTLGPEANTIPVAYRQQ